jgi:hypothetical protein
LTLVSIDALGADEKAPETTTEKTIDEKEEDLDIIEPERTISGFISSPDVDTAYHFPAIQNKKFPIGEHSEILLGFTNTGDSPFRVEYIRGYLVSPLDWTYFIQNFTGYIYNVSVAPNEAHTLSYKFRPDKQLDEREFGLLIDVFYTNDDNETFATTFYNETVSLYEVEGGFDAKTFFAYVTIVGIIGVIGYILYIGLLSTKFAKKMTKSKAPSASETKEGTDEINYEYIDPSVLKHLKKRPQKSEKTESK